ncbi:ribonuclease P protein component [Caldimonas brevitalea]|nr:ribonuclease P protein component [Caldimonas brevitalea]
MRRLKQKADFERALGAGSAGVVGRSPHFIAHFVPGTDLAPQAPDATAADELSTGVGTEAAGLVDVSVAQTARRAPVAQVGTVLPKRWARRSVTRSLLKRQVFAAFERQGPAVPPGVWVVRLRATFDRAQFVSAASDALRHAARDELDALLRQALPRAAAKQGPPPKAAASP